MIDCIECKGGGKIYISTVRSCTVKRGECCGGCGYYVKCKECKGTGEVEIEDIEIKINIDKEIRILKNIYSFLLVSVIGVLTGLVAFIIGTQI